MSRINRTQLSPKELGALLDQFDSLLGTLNKSATNNILNEVLGHEERIMLAKRLIGIVLLTEGYTEYRTAQTLKLSPSTTGKLASRIAGGEFAETLRILKKNKKNYIKILETIDSILHFGGILPRYTEAGKRFRV